MKIRFERDFGLFLAVISWIVFLHFATPTSLAQALPQAPSAQPVPTELSIVVVQGEGATIDVHQHVGTDPVVRIEDQRQQPISGAVVVFTLPTEGATGDFQNGGKTLTVTTDNRGMAVGKGLKINQVPGKLQIHVTVSYKGLSARTNIMETVEGPPIHGTQGISKGSKSKWIIIVAIIGAGAAGGA